MHGANMKISVYFRALSTMSVENRSWMFGDMLRLHRREIIPVCFYRYSVLKIKPVGSS